MNIEKKDIEKFPKTEKTLLSIVILRCVQIISIVTCATIMAVKFSPWFLLLLLLV